MLFTPSPIIDLAALLEVLSMKYSPGGPLAACHLKNLLTFEEGDYV